MSKLKIAGYLVSLTLFAFLFSGTVSAANTPDYMRTFKPGVSASPRVWHDPKPTGVTFGTMPSKPPSTGNDVVTRTFKPQGSPMSCEARVKAIKTRSESLVKNVENTTSKFTSILSNVDNFYTGTVVPSGKTVPNYTALKADVAKKQANVAAALGSVKSDVGGFNCTDLQTKVADFNTDARTVKSELAAYRSSIQKVITAVHSVRKTGAGNLSPKPRATCLPLPSCLTQGCKIQLDSNLNWCKTSPSPVASLRPRCYTRPACLDENPPCKIALIEGGVWCPVRVPQTTTTK